MPKLPVVVPGMVNKGVATLTRILPEPVGRAIMKKMPQVMAESVQISQRQMQHVMPSLQQMFSDMEAELAQADAQKGAQKP